MSCFFVIFFGDVFGLSWMFFHFAWMFSVVGWVVFGWLLGFWSVWRMVGFWGGMRHCITLMRWSVGKSVASPEEGCFSMVFSLEA